MVSEVEADDIIDLYQQLDDGCKEHPAYRAKRPPRADCKGCRELWQKRLELETLLEDYIPPMTEPGPDG